MGTTRPLHGAGGQGGHPLEELHGRVRELRDRAVAITLAGALSALFWALSLAGGGTAAAQPRAEDLGALASGLESPERVVREDAITRLSTLPAEALPAIGERLVALRRGRPAPDEALTILHEIRRATGSRRADDLVDLAGGVPAVLETRRDRAVIRMVEPLLLMRSLERLATTEALVLLPEVLRLDRGAWEMEGRRATLRLGDRAAAAILRARGHEDVAGREWARWSMRELALENAGRLVQRLGPRDLADVLDAWGATRTIDAMPVVASYVDDPRRLVREAARRGLAGYGQNAIWQAREQYRLRIGEDASDAWGWQRTTEELFRRLDERRLAGVRELEDAARAALADGDPAHATRELELLLARAPDAGSHEIAALFASVGDAWMQRDERAPARLAFERAIRLAPGDPARERWDARLSFLEAEDALASGVLDLEAYRAAAFGDPTCVRCAEVLSTLEAQGAPPAVEGDNRRVALGTASLLLALLGIALLRTPRQEEENVVLAVLETGTGDPEPGAVDPADATLS